MFRDVKGFEGYYSIDENGILKSMDRFVKHSRNGYSLKKGKLKKPCLNKKTGYYMVALFKDNIAHHFLLHRLVAMAFPDICGEWFEGCVVDHINTIRSDNRAVNLKVCTTKDNINNPITKKRSSEVRKGKSHTAWNKGLKMPERSGKKHPKSKAVFQYTKDGRLIAEYCSTAEASQKTSILNTSITNCLTKRSNSAGGYVFKYEK